MHNILWIRNLSNFTVFLIQTNNGEVHTTLLPTTFFILAEKKQKRNSKPTNPKLSDDMEPDTSKLKLPPFARHSNHINNYDSPKYKSGDIKICNGVTYYFL